MVMAFAGEAFFPVFSGVQNTRRVALLQCWTEKTMIACRSFNESRVP